jgi:hypothetical protein
LRNPVFTNTLRGLLRGRMLLVALVFCGLFFLMQTMSIRMESNQLADEMKLVERESYVVRTVYIEALRKDSSASLREETLHFSALFVVLLGVFTLSAVFGREAHGGGLERILVSPRSRASALGSIAAAAFVFNQCCITFLFIFLNLRLRLFTGGFQAGATLEAYLLLTAIHASIFSVALACQTLLRQSTAFFFTLAVAFTGFASYIIEIAYNQLAGPALKISIAVYSVFIPRVGTMFYMALSRARPEYVQFGVHGPEWIALEVMKSAAFIFAAFWVFNRKNY